MLIATSQDHRRRALLAVGLVGALAVSTALALTGPPPVEAILLIALVSVVVLAHGWYLSWSTLLTALVLVVLLVPIRRYSFPAALPFALEPYRLLVALVLAAWLASLLADRHVRIRRSGFEAPIALILVAVAASLLANAARVGALETEVTKRVSFLVSFFLVFFLVVSVVRSSESADRVVKALVTGGAVVGFTALIESRSGFNAFDHLSGIVPLLRDAEALEVPRRGARLRVYSSAQHPIALGAVLVMTIPFALYLAVHARQRRWWLAALVLAMGTLATVSRTGILMLAVVVVVFLWLRPRETKRWWPALVPLVVLVHFALPGTLGSLKQSFLPEGGLIAEQRGAEGTSGAGRIADLGPSIDEWSRSPLAGHGFGTRIVDSKREDSDQILDNQWLGTLLETGVLGVAAWSWLFLRYIRRLGRAARPDDSRRGLLLAAIAASIAAYAVGMFTYDAFAFVQVTFVLFVVAGLGAALLAEQPIARVRALRRPHRAPAVSLDHP